MVPTHNIRAFSVTFQLMLHDSNKSQEAKHVPAPSPSQSAKMSDFDTQLAHATRKDKPIVHGVVVKCVDKTGEPHPPGLLFKQRGN